MRFVKATALVAAGALMLIVYPVAAQQRVVRLTDADQAIMDDFWKTCAPQVANAKKTMAGKPDPLSDAEFRQWMNGMPTELREGAKFQEVKADAAYYRETIAHARKVLSEPNQTDPTTPFMVPIYICLLETMIRHEPGSGSAAKGGTPVNPMPASDGTATGCVVVDDAITSFGGLRNKCGYPVYVTYCAYKPAQGAWNEAFNCEKQQFGLDSIAANGTQAAHTKDAERIYFFACQKPKMPSQSKFDGTMMMSMCK